MSIPSRDARFPLVVVAAPSNEGHLRVRLPITCEQPRVRVLDAAGRDCSDFEVMVVGYPEKSTVDDMEVNLFDLLVKARDWEGGLKRVTLVVSDGMHEARGQVDVASAIARFEPANSRRDGYTLLLYITRIQGLSSVRTWITWKGREIEPAKWTVNCTRIATLDARGVWTEYDELPFGVREEMADFHLVINAVLRDVDLGAEPGIVHVEIVDINGVRHHASMSISDES